MKSFRRSPVDEDNRQNHTANDITRVREKILPGNNNFLFVSYILFGLLMMTGNAEYQSQRIEEE